MRATQPSKWLLLAPELYLAPGGIARVSRHYLQALAENRGGRALTAVVLNDDEISPKNLASSGADGVRALGCGHSKLRCALNLWRETRGQSVHVTCTHVALSPLLWLLQRFRSALTFDIVVHGIEVWKPISRPQRLALGQARLILSVSDYTRREIVSRYPALDAHCQVLPNALDPSFEFDAHQVDSEDANHGRILAVSRLAGHDWEKGIDHLIQAIPAVRLAHQNAHLHIVGDGVDRTRLKAIADALPEPGVVTFLGRVSDEALRRELTSCQLFALPSRKEGFGLVYLEAMAAGKPCVVANAGGAPEVINAYSGVLVPYGEPKLLAETLIEALRKDWDSAKIKQRASEFAFTAFVNRWRTLTSLAI